MTTTPIIPTIAVDLPADHLLRQIIEALEAHPEVRQPLLRVLLTEDFLALPEQMTEVLGRLDHLQGEFEDFRTETRAGFQAVNERIDETNRALNERIDETGRALNERIDETNRTMQEQFRQTNERMQEQFREVNDRMSENIRITEQLRGHSGRLRGTSYEELCRRQIGVILDGWLDGPVVADLAHINAIILAARRRNEISRYEYQESLSPDIIAREVDDTSHSGRLAVVEASVTFNRDDLEKAARRAEIIGRVTGLRTDAFIATHYEWPAEVAEMAHRLGVNIIQHESPEHTLEYWTERSSFPSALR